MIHLKLINKKVFIFFLFGVILLLMSFNLMQKEDEKIDYVPNAETAVKVAEVLWLPLYGESIYEHKPFSAKLQNGIWIVSGKQKKQKGGYPYAEIQKSDCKVLKITHFK